MTDASERKPFNVLFLCTGNSARSIMAEAILNREGPASGPIRPAASRTARLHPYTLDLLRSCSSTQPDSAPRAGTNSPSPMRRSISFSPSATTRRREKCPFWPGQPMTAHWGVPDPAAATGNEAEIALAFADSLPDAEQPHLGLRQPADREARPPLAANASRHHRQDHGAAAPRPPPNDPRSPDAGTARLPRRRWAPPFSSPPSSARASWPSGCRAGTRRWRFSATPSRPARSWSWSSRSSPPCPAPTSTRP